MIPKVSPLPQTQYWFSKKGFVVLAQRLHNDVLKCLLIKATDNDMLPLQSEQKLNMQAANTKPDCGSIQTPEAEECELEVHWVEGLFWRLFSG